jgi:MoxR-like ATPase
MSTATNSTVDPVQVREFADTAARLRAELARRIVGLESVIDDLLIALLSGGHCLLVGVPGLAKTLLIRSLAELTDLDFRRIQFTPDLMPSDIVGIDVMLMVL